MLTNILILLHILVNVGSFSWLKCLLLPILTDIKYFEAIKNIGYYQ